MWVSASFAVGGAVLNEPKERTRAFFRALCKKKANGQTNIRGSRHNTTNAMNAQDNQHRRELKQQVEDRRREKEKKKHTEMERDRKDAERLQK